MSLATQLRTYTNFTPKQETTTLATLQVLLWPTVIQLVIEHATLMVQVMMLMFLHETY